MSEKQPPKSLMSRIGVLENTIKELIPNLNHKLQQHDGYIEQMLEKLDAIISLHSMEKEVDDHIKTQRKARAEAESAQERQAREMAMADGYLVAVPKVGPKTVVVGHYTRPDDEPTAEMTIAMGSVKNPAVLSRLMEQPVGAAVDMGVGNLTFHVKELYEIDEDKAREVHQAKQAAAAAQNQALVEAESLAAVGRVEEANAVLDSAPPAEEGTAPTEQADV